MGSHVARGGAGPGWGVYGRMRSQQLEQAGASGAPPSPLLRSPSLGSHSRSSLSLKLQKYVQCASNESYTTSFLISTVLTQFHLRKGNQVWTLFRWSLLPLMFYIYAIVYSSCMNRDTEICACIRYIHLVFIPTPLR